MSANDDDSPPGVPEWVVTYGDMMSLLLTFFIMLVSMSELKEEGLVRKHLDAIREAFGAQRAVSGVPGPSAQTTTIYNQRNSEGIRSQAGTRRASRDSKGPSGAHQTVRRINHGTVVTLGGPAVFDRFEAALTEKIRVHLDIIAEAIADRENRVVIRGHATPEPLPPDSPYRDPWELSFARAHAVSNYLQNKGIGRHRLIVSAAGDTEPRIVSRQKEQQKQNRRVDVFLIDSYISRPRNP